MDDCILSSKINEEKGRVARLNHCRYCAPGYNPPMLKRPPVMALLIAVLRKAIGAKAFLLLRSRVTNNCRWIWISVIFQPNERLQARRLAGETGVANYRSIRSTLVRG
jgi:hypothetical protein